MKRSEEKLTATHQNFSLEGRQLLSQRRQEKEKENGKRKTEKGKRKTEQRENVKWTGRSEY